MKTTSRFLLSVILLTLHGSLVCGQPGPGYALSFNGVNSYVGMQDPTGTDIVAEVTVEFWQKVNAVAVQSTFCESTFVNGSVFNAHVPYADGKVYWDFGDIAGGGRLSYTPPVSIVGSWQHFAMVASQTGNYMRIYRNGVLEASKTGMTPLVHTNLDLILGGAEAGVPFGGQLDEFRIWKVARSQSDIQANMYHSIPDPTSTDLVAYVRFDEGEGNYAYDSSGQNHTGTLSNSPTWVASTVPFVAGVAALPASEVTTNSATLNGWVNPNTFPTTAWFQWGTTTNYGNIVSIPCNNEGCWPGLASSITGLTPNQLYNYRVVASNNFGVAFGDNVSFFADIPSAPDAETLPASQVTTNSATLNGWANPNGHPRPAWFEWGTTTNYGNIVSIGPDCQGSCTAVRVSSSITNLTPHQLYNYRLVASNSFGIAVGNNVSFSANIPPPPIVVTLPASQATTNSATLSGWLNPNEFFTMYWFQWGITTNYGNTTIPWDPFNGGVSVTSSITNLTAYQLYNYRLVASNSFGTAYGDNVSFNAGIPQLEILRGIDPQGGGETSTVLIVRWPAAATSFSLETTTNLTGAVSWDPCPWCIPVIVSNQNTVAIPDCCDRQRFFRLHQP